MVKRRVFLGSALSATTLWQMRMAGALQAFEEFFFSRARDIYPRYDFVRMTDDEYGEALTLG
jgi:hypothetical protein